MPECMPEWFFKEIEKGTPERNPRETEFFRITSPAEAMVREFIQNSLDARKNQEIIKIKISLNRINRNNVSTFLDINLKNHLIACDMLDDRDYPEEVSYLLLEDFGTTGLDGSYEADAGDGNFYNFWWREGISQKTGQRAGRWGLGKTTFHTVSKIRSFFGLTVRKDGRTLLMGKALLKTHSLHNRRYHYFGYFCGNNYSPVEDVSILSRFKENFGISRSNTEPGLSIVIPLPVDEINFESIMAGIIQHYYYPVLAGKLNAVICDGARQEDLNKDNLIEKAAGINWDKTEWEGMNIRQILGFVKDVLDIQPVTLQIQQQDDPKITRESFADQLDAVKNNFLAGNPVKFHIPVVITKDQAHQKMYITILLKKFPEFRKPFEAYIRSGILISEIKMLGNRPVAGLLVADDPVVSEFLGDCETPAHTNWNERTEGFAEKYKNAARILRFIKKSMSQIVSILDEPPRERQVDFLKEIFSIPVSSEEGAEKVIYRTTCNRRFSKKPGVFSIFWLQGGFRITLNPKHTDFSSQFRAIVKMAYATRRGNPFAQYEKFDFDVAGTSINITTQDCNVLSRDGNMLEVKVSGQNFELKVTGFDPNRDLVVDIKKVEESPDHEENI